MNENESGGAWFEALPRTGQIYRLIERSGASEIRETRIRALKALGESGDPRAVRPLMECTQDDSAEIRRYATEGLFKLCSPRGVDALHDRLKDRSEEWTIRTLAADALGEIRSLHAIDVLVARLQDPGEDPSLREYVARILGRIRAEQARAALMECCRREYGALGKVAEEALRSLDTKKRSISQRNRSLQISREDQERTEKAAQQQ